MLTLLFLNLALANHDVAWTMCWHTDYDQAARQALADKKDLFIHFREDDQLDEVLGHADVRARLARFVCLRVPADYQHNGRRLLDHAALAEMRGRPGVAIISLHDERHPAHYQAVSVHPLVRSRYAWAPSYGVEEVKIILDLPAWATLSQRSMMFAFRVHPERPQSVCGEPHAAFLGHAERHSLRQAGMQLQHHADLVSASSKIREDGAPSGASSEIVAESWGSFVGGENVLEASFACINAWRQSPGHWGSASRAWRFFGYDIAVAANGTWYATGIFGD